MTKSWKTEVLVGSSWSTNALRFSTKEEAEASVQELMSRWYLPSAGRAAESEDTVNYRFDFGANRNVRLDI